MTAVEWLQEQIMTSKYFYKVLEDINSRGTVAQPNIFEQAKEMEKEQIVESYENGRQDYYSKDNRIYGEQYYNETFKSE